MDYLPSFAFATSPAHIDRGAAYEFVLNHVVAVDSPTEWLATGHLPDIALVSPIFRRGVLVGFAGTAAHVPDIGGSPALGATDLTSEGLLIPPLRLYRAGVRNEEVVALLRANVRLPTQVWGDLEAQLSAHEVRRRRATELLDDTGEPDFAALAEAVHTITDGAMRSAIRAIPDGVYRSALDADGVPDQATHIECAVTVRGDEIEIDYTGSSPQVPYATNCTLNYTTAYTVYPLKLLLDPATRGNDGSYRAITVRAPEGSILNPTFPAPVLARHLTGHLLSCAVCQALADVLWDRVIAGSGVAPALRVQFAGRRDDGEPFAQILFASAGMGASAHADGRSATAFPTNSGSGSIEALEADAPLGVRGFVTDGRVRDVNELRSYPYPVYATGLCVARSHMRLVEVGGPVTVAGTHVEPGDVIHGDEHGVLNIPRTALPAILEKAELIRRDEQQVVEWSRSAGFSVPALLEMRRIRH